MAEISTRKRRSSLRTRRHVVRPFKVAEETWILRLYVAGETMKSVAAFNNLQALCEDKLEGRYSIEVIDLLKQPKLARDNQILAVPTLVRKLPKPVRNIIGDLSNSESVLVGLDLVSHASRWSE